MKDTFRVLVKNGGAMLQSKIHEVENFMEAAENWLTHHNFDAMTDSGWKYDLAAEVYRRKLVQTPAYGELSFVVEFTGRTDVN